MERLSIELTDRCEKGCAFCYARATATGTRSWDPVRLVTLVRDCAEHGTRAVSLGGGEPLEYPALGEILVATRGRLARSITTSGLRLDDALPDLARWRPDKVHLSIHHPGDAEEVERIVRQVADLEARGIRAGVNLLVRRSGVDDARAAARALHAAGIRNDRILFLPMRLGDTPTAEEVASVAEGPFRPASCLGGCQPSPRFASLDVDAGAARCPYARRRRRLAAFSFAALQEALEGLGLEPCDEAA